MLNERSPLMSQHAGGALVVSQQSSDMVNHIGGPIHLNHSREYYRVSNNMVNE
jgi:hypothetical protein